MAQNFYVFVSDNPFTSYDLNTTLNQSGVSGYYYGPYANPGVIAVNRTGRYVRVQLAGSQYLVLGEVQVWGGSTGQVNWIVPDHLGTPRMIADQTGSLANMKRHDYLPFGEEIGLIGGRTGLKGFMNDGTRQKFTGYERDWETGLDYAKARYDANAQGRFLSVDPLGAKCCGHAAPLGRDASGTTLGYKDGAPNGAQGIEHHLGGIKMGAPNGGRARYRASPWGYKDGRA
jgi:RHS repeat-associated protein